MERESFENEEVAKIMNEHFVNIKVDREERPDIDKIYMVRSNDLNRSWFSILMRIAMLFA